LDERASKIQAVQRANALINAAMEPRLLRCGVMQWLEENLQFSCDIRPMSGEIKIFTFYLSSREYSKDSYAMCVILPSRIFYSPIMFSPFS